MRRQAPPPALRPRILNRQRYRCLYCGHRFGTVLYRGARMITSTVQWDHRVPYAYLQANPDGNWAAACQVCNGIKSDLHFDDLRQLRRWMRTQWRNLPVEWHWIPSVSSEDDPHLWAIEFSRYLCRPPLDDEESPDGETD